MVAAVCGFWRMAARAVPPASNRTARITDALGRSVWVPEDIKYVICSGSGCLRLLTYLNAQDRIVAVDDMELQQKTGIPVVALAYGGLGGYRADLDQSLRIMGKILEKTDRAEAVIAYFDHLMIDLKNRTASVAGDRKVSCYVGGIAYKGPHGFLSTEPAYPVMAVAPVFDRMDAAFNDLVFDPVHKQKQADPERSRTS